MNLNDVTDLCLSAMQGVMNGKMTHYDAAAIARTAAATCKAIELHHKLGGDIAQYIDPRKLSGKAAA